MLDKNKKTTGHSKMREHHLDRKKERKIGSQDERRHEGNREHHKK
jgi:hypothetical protein